MPAYLVITQHPYESAYITEFDNIEDALTEYLERKTWSSVEVYLAEKLDIKTVVTVSKSDTVLTER